MPFSSNITMVYSLSDQCPWLYVLCLVTQSCLTLCDPMDCSLPGSSVHGDSPGKNTGVGLPCPPPGVLHNPETEPRSPTLQAYSLSSEPPGKAMNTGVGSLTFLQGIFPTQEMNQGLLHCRWILYQLSHQESYGYKDPHQKIFL